MELLPGSGYLLPQQLDTLRVFCSFFSFSFSSSLSLRATRAGAAPQGETREVAPSCHSGLGVVLRKRPKIKKKNLRSCILTAELWNYDRAAARGSTARENGWRRRGLKLNVGPYTFFVLYIILNYYTYYIYIVLKIIKYNITRQCLEWLCQRFPQLQYVGHIQWDDYYAG